ncbi:MAG: hypothetical protein ACTSVY_02020 [Candidatus Helarchaeota archaeon]
MGTSSRQGRESTEYSRDKVIKAAMGLSAEFRNTFFRFRKSQTEYLVYYCHHVRQLVDLLKKSGKSSDVGLIHDIFKRMFGKLMLGEKIKFEKSIKGRKIDIIDIGEQKLIEIKTITEANLHKIKHKLAMVSKLRPRCDELWIFYFLKCEAPEKIVKTIKRNENISHECVYLLVFIKIMLSGSEDLAKINSELENGVKEVVKKSAEEINIHENIIIPLGNVVISEELRRELKEKEAKLKEIGAALKEKDAALKEKDAALKEKDAALKEKDAALKEKDAALAKEQAEKLALKKELEQLKSKLKVKNNKK